MEKILRTLKEKSTIHNGENYTISNISKETIDGVMNGWLCGHFYPKESVFHRNDIEIVLMYSPVCQQFDEVMTSMALRTVVKNLRKKISTDFIRNISGQGYKLIIT